MSGKTPFSREQDTSRIVQAVRDLFAGRSNAVGSCTLTANQATTSVTATNCGLNTKPVLFPTTANGAAELAAGGMYVSAVSRGSFTITHANNAQTDRTFNWIALG